MERKVASFLSCQLNDVVTTHELGKWYQVYGKVTVPGIPGLLSNVKDYEVCIENYSKNTAGADYCVDQIMFYSRNAKLNVMQGASDCDKQALPVNIYIDSESLKDVAEGDKIYWRICDSKGNPLPKEKKLYDDKGELEYGSTVVTAMGDIATLPDVSTFNKPYGYFKDSDGNVWFSLAFKNFALDPGQQYYISVYTKGEHPINNKGEWGNAKEPCSIYSPLFFPRRLYLSFNDGDGNVVTTVKTGCSEDAGKEVELKAVINIPYDDEATGFKAFYDLHFDYFLGSAEELKAYQVDGEFLKGALEDYREKTDNENHKSDLDPNYETADTKKFAVIKDAIEKGKLYLTYSNEFKQTISAEHNVITALPIEQSVETGKTLPGGGKEILPVCSPLEFTFDVDASGDAPVLQLGFEDVTYPEDYVCVVRVGREQLLNMQKASGYLLHVPVNTFKTDDKATANTGAVVIVGDLELLKEGTSDPTVAANINKVATFAADEEVSASKMYVSLNFHGTDVTKPNFREGFAYKMFFQVKKKEAGEGACTGNVEFILKVVPEFVTWTGNAGTTSWNNDENWSRSQKAELYKDKTGQNTPTAAQGALDSEGGLNNGEYKNNAEIDAALGQPATYVPMKFTYVTMPTHNRAPVLTGLTTGTDGIYNNVESGATENIQYDMLVKVENKCAHTITGDIYDCEKFYGNTCNQIYFKPEAELVNQQHLTYNKAWVEKELEANKWYLMASPLQATYAGDMYVPTSNGRQETEAFQPINFVQTKGYSRTKYPIYQRSWNLNDAKVYTKTNDSRGEYYSANLPYASVVEGKVAEWSHVYNDVQVPYSSMLGFSIRAHKKDQSGNALIRLPKEDTSYDYYDWEDNAGDVSDTYKPVSKESGVGKFVTAGDGKTSVSVRAAQNQLGYVLVGNPYMASVDMTKFFNTNGNGVSQGGYWTYQGNSAEAHTGTAGKIRPLEAFFVKVSDGTTELNFTPDMMIDGNSQQSDTGNDTPSNAPALRMTARNNSGQSVAKVMTAEGATADFAENEDVETLFDSNLSGVPMVYTVASQQAVSINKLQEIDVLPFGVTISGDDMVEVTIEGTDMADAPLYLYDATSGAMTEIAEGSTINVQPNDYGRYYLTTRSSIGLGDSEKGGIVVSVRDHNVTVRASENIDAVTVTTLGGVLHNSYSGGGNTVEFSLQPGVYVIEAKSGDETKTVKIRI